MDISKILAGNVKYYRNKHKMTQNELGKLSKTHRVYIDSIENKHRNISIKKLEAFGKVFNIDAYELLKVKKGVKYD